MTSTTPRFIALLGISLLAGCASAPPPPDWKMNAQSALESYEKAWLDGHTALAELNFDRARSEIARTARLDHLERADLIRCAVETAGVERRHCAALESLATQAAHPEERAYARFLTGKWSDIDAKALPAQYTDLIKAKDEAACLVQLAKIESPKSRLIAAGMLFQRAALPPAGIAIAIETASERGWRRPLLAWLKIELDRLQQVGNAPEREKIQQRIDLLMTSMPAEK